MDFKKMISSVRKKLGRDDDTSGDAYQDAKENGEFSGKDEAGGLQSILNQGNQVENVDGSKDAAGKPPVPGEDGPKFGDASQFSLPEADASMSQGDKGQIFGLKRKVVMGVFVGIFGLVAMALIYSSGQSEQPKTKAPQETNQQIAGEKSFKSSNSDKLSDDYGELERANAEKMKKNGTGNTPANVQAQKVDAATGSSTAPAASTVHPASSSSSLPAVPRSQVVAAAPVVPSSYSQPYTLPSQQAPAAAPAAQAPAQPQQSEEEKTRLQRIKDTLESAIGFSFGGGGTQTADASSSGGESSGEAASTATQATPAPSSAYFAPSPNTVTAGTVIPAMLLSGINTDTPGQVIAQVMADVYDPSGSNLLIPAGSRVLGKMDGKDGSTGRVGVTFDQVVLPDGGAWAVGSSLVAMDAEGFTGLQGTIHKHTASNLTSGLFNSALSALSTINVDRVTIDGGALFREMDTRAATTTIDPGYQFNVYVTNNISF